MSGMQSNLFGNDAPAPMHRLFFATSPTPEDRDALHAAIERLRPWIPRARWVKATRHHVTLRYLGESAGRRDDWIAAATRAVQDWHPPQFELTLDHLRALGNPRRPALALASAAPSAGLDGFWRELRERMLRAGFRDQDGRTFLPHLTVAYTEPSPPLPPIEPLLLRATSYRLLLSVQGEDEYTCLGQWPLSGA